MEMLDAAKEYVEMGYALIPCDGKDPARYGGALKAKAGTVPAFAQGANLGIVAGRGVGRVVILDFDELEHPFCAWVLENYPSAPRVRTGSGKLHFYFADEAKKGETQSVTAAHELYSVRRGAGLAVVPPSVHPGTGKAYTWEVPLVPPDLLPPWDAQCQARHGLYRLASEVAKLKQGARQDGLYQAAIRAWRLPLPDDVVHTTMVDAAHACGLSSSNDVERQIDRARAFARETGALPDDEDVTLAARVIAGLGTAACIGGDVWRYEPAQGVWAIVPEAHMLQRVFALHGTPTASGPATVGAAKGRAVVSVVQAELYAEALPGDAPSLAFADCTVRWLPGAGLVCAPYDASLGTTDRYGFAFEGPTDTPVFDAYIEACVPDAGQRAAVLEFLGAALLGQAPRLCKGQMYKGPKGSGKSTLLELFESCVPAGRAIALSPSAVGDRFGASQLTERTLLCIVDEYGRDNQIHEDGWKSAVLGHPITIERKYRDPRSVRPKAAWAAAGNTWPSCPGVHDSFFQRWSFVLFPRVFRGTDAEDKSKLADLLRERDAVVRRAILAGSRALDAGVYASAATDIDIAAQWQASGDTVAEWATVCTAAGGRTSVRDAFREYLVWAQRCNYRPVGRAEFMRRVVDIRGVANQDAKHKRLALTVIPEQ